MELVLCAAVIVVVLVLLMLLSPKMEGMVGEMNWFTMARGLNASNVDGYGPVIKVLSAMEKTNAAGITTK